MSPGASVDGDPVCSETARPRGIDDGWRPDGPATDYVAEAAGRLRRWNGVVIAPDERRQTLAERTLLEHMFE